MTACVWIDALGAPTTIVDVTFDEDARKVYATADTLRVMARAVLTAGILDDADAMSTAAGILAIEPDALGRYDVTEADGGWVPWQDAEVVA